MSEASISVAMATCNGERFLRDQLDSLAQQTLLPSELVVCDDGSTDGTLEILRRFAESAPFPVQIHQNEMRLGFGFNFLGALTRCRGELVAFCDQDDIWLERKLRLCAEVMRDREVWLVSHSARVFSSSPLPRPMRHPGHRRTLARSCWDLPTHQVMPGFSIVLRRAALEKSPPPSYSSRHARWAVHDWWAVAAALSGGRVVLLPEDLVLYRLHDRNVTLRHRATGLARIAPDPRINERAAEIKAELAGFLRYAASFCDESASASFHEYIYKLELVGHLYADRARLHEACGHRLKAIRTLVGMLAKGDYSSRGFGVKALARDAFLAAFWPTLNSLGARMPDLLGNPPRVLHRIRTKTKYLRVESPHTVSARWSRRPGTTQVKRNPELIVSLTTIPERVGKIHLCLDSLLRQSIKPDRIILWLGMDNGDRGFPFTETSLPRPLARMQKRGVEIRWCRDIGPFTKLYPALRAFPEALVVTADDDIFYPREWLEQLFEAYRKEPQYIHCHRAHLMKYDKAGMPLPYQEWNFLAQGFQGPSMDLFPTGCGGVLYAPGHLNPEVLNEDSYRALTPHNDDVWVKAMAQLNHVPFKKIGKDTISLQRIRISNDRKLQTINVTGNRNDPQIEAVRRKYGTFMLKASPAQFDWCPDGQVPAERSAGSFRVKASSRENLP